MYNTYGGARQDLPSGTAGWLVLQPLLVLRFVLSASAPPRAADRLGALQVPRHLQVLCHSHTPLMLPLILGAGRRAK
jgi:hypothetical protein